MSRYLVLSLAIVLFSCSGSEERDTIVDIQAVPEPEYRKDLLNDSLYSSVFGAAESFSLLLPANYAPEKSSPVIFFLDPHASGSLPLKKYRTLSNSHGYILVGSNVSRNNMDVEDSKSTVLALLDECRNMLNIDPSRVYVAGFSGGARIAGSLTDQPNISGIIYCSAGFEVKTGISKYKLFVGIAGEKDMNYLEVLSTHNRLNSESLKNRFIEYDGKHEWPGLEQMQEAADYLAIHEETKTKRKEEGRMKMFVTVVDSEIAAHRNKKDTLRLFVSLNKKFEFLYGGPLAKGYKDTLDVFEQTPFLKNWSARHSEVLNAEVAYQKEIAAWLESASSDIWKTKAAELRVRTLNKDDKLISNSAHRLLGYMSLVLYSITSNMIRKPDFVGAKTFAEIYRIVDPENPEQCYFNAWVKANKGECSTAYSLLEEAVKFGFKDSNRLKNEVVLKPCLSGSDKMNSLLFRMARSL